MLQRLHKTFAFFIVFPVLFLGLSGFLEAQNTPCTAVSLLSNMPDFQTYSTSGLTNSGVPAPECGGNPGADIWFQTTISATGYINIVTLAGTMTNAAMAIYTGTCNNLQEFACTESDNCGNSIMPIWDWGNLAPGTVVYIRLWIQSGANGTFDVQVTNTFSPPGSTPLVPAGDAFTLDPECVQLTVTSPSQEGCAWSPNQVDFTQPFSNNVMLNFGNIDANGADGICMVYHRDPAGMAACGIGGGQIGSGGIQNSFIIEFDTWDNGVTFSDIVADHVSVDVNGDMMNAINGPFGLGNIENGLDHEVLFTWDPATNFYQIFFDGNLVLSGNYDIINNCFGGQTSAWCGFTGSTGASSNNQVVCNIAPDVYPSGDQSIVEVEICEGDSYFAGGANQTSSGNYSDTFAAYNGCDSIVVTSLTVNPAPQNTVNKSICNGESYFAGGANQTTSGTYMDTFMTPAGCDSIVITNLTVNPDVQNTLNEAICQGESFFAGGAFQTTSGTYTDTYMAANGCDSVVVTNLTVNPVSQFTQNESICDGDSFFAGGANQTTSGTYSDTYMAANGCDSVVMTVLTVNPNYEFTLNESICDGDSFFAGGAFQTTSGTYTDMYMSSGGCDSTVITNLTVHPNVQNTLFETICEGESFFAGGSLQTTSGTYNDLYSSAKGCDSLVITNLTVNPNIQNTLFETICDGESLFVGGANQTTSGSYTDVYPAFNGCDSTVITNLTVNPNIEITLNQAICQGDVFYAGGAFQTTSGIYTDVYPAYNGCDSTVITQLTVNPNIVTVLNETICAGDCFFIDNIPFCTGGTHQVVLLSYFNCDSTVQLNLTVVDPQVNIVEPLIITCDHPTVTLDGSNSASGPGITYLWTGSNPNCFVGNENNPVINVSCPDLYTLLVFQDIGGQQCIGLQEVVVQEYTEIPNAVINPPLELNCSDPCTTLDASPSDNGPPYVPVWTNQNGIVSNQLNPTVCQPGTYVLTVTNEDNGCAATASVTIDLDSSASFADAGPDALIDCQNTMVTLDGSNSSVGPDYQLQWEDLNHVVLGNNALLTVDEPGTYILSVSNQSNGCMSSDTVIVTINTTLPVADIGPSGILDCANASLSLDGTGSLPVSNYGFSWQSPLGTEVGTGDLLDVNTPGTYFLVVNNLLNGCSDTTSTIILENMTPPVADAGPDLSIDCSVGTVTFDGSGSMGAGTLGFEWLDESDVIIGTNSSLAANAPGTYFLIVTDTDNSCSDTTSVILTSASTYPLAFAGTDTLINCTNPSITLSASGSDSGPNYQYEWQDENGNSIGADSLVSVSNSGLYTLLVTDTDNGCTTSDMVAVGTDFMPPFSDAGSDQVLDCLSNSVTLDGSNSQQGANISYSWLDSSNNPVGTGITLSVNAADTYTLEVTDMNNGCSATSTTQVTQQIDAPVADAGPDLILNCMTSVVILDGSNSTTGPNITAEWINQAGTSLGNTLQLQTSTPGIYGLILQDNSNGCTSVSNALVSLDTISPALSPLNDVIINCFSPETTLGQSLANSNPAWAFSWTDQNGLPVATTDTLHINAAGTYTLLVTNNDNFCETTVSANVTEDFATPAADAGNDATLDCVTSSILLDGSNSQQGADISYQWEDSNQALIGNGISVQVNMADTYTLVVTNQENGCSDSDSVVIDQQLDAPVADAGLDLVLNCSINMVTLDGSNSSSGPNINAEWTNENGDPVGNTLQVQTALPGMYTLSISDLSNGCISVSNALVSIDTLAPAINPLDDEVLNCNAPQTTLGTMLSITNPGWTFNWEDEFGALVAQTDTLYVTDAGTYTLTVANTSNACESTLSATVTEDFTVPVADAGNDGTLTCNTLSIILDGSNSDTGPGFLTEWQNSQNEVLAQTPALSVATVDTYSLFVTNLTNGCMASDQVTVAIDTLSPVADAGTGGIITCTTQDILLDGNGSTFSGNATFSWTDENNNEIGTALTQNVSSPGMYFLTVFHPDNGCEDVESVTVLENTTLPVANAGEDVELNCYSPSTTLDGGNSSSGANITYAWQDASSQTIGNTTTLMVSAAEAYTFIVTDTDNGCTASDLVEVSENFAVPVADAGADWVLDCQTTDVLLGGSGTSVGPTISYQWTNGAGEVIGSDMDQFTDEAGTFALMVFDNANGCADTTMVVVTIDQDYPVVAGAVNEILTCVQLTATLDATGTSVGNEFSYNWSSISGGVIVPGPDNLTPYVGTPGTYQMTVTNNDNQCATTVMFEVFQDITPPVANAGQGFELNCHAPISNLNGSLSIPAGVLEYQWSSANGQFESATDIPQPTISFPGNYLLTVVNTQNGCTDTDQVIITSNFITGMEVETVDPLCFDETGTLVVQQVSGGIPPFQYSINGGATFGPSNVFPNIPAGQYDVVVMDANDCELEATALIVAPDEILLTLDADATILLGDHFQLFALTNLPLTQIDTILWSPADFLSCTGCLSPLATPFESIEYTVEVIDTNGCNALATQAIFVDRRSNVFIPNVFSPNGDGNNDVFMIFSDLKSVASVHSFQIYNRWGEAVFEAFDFPTNNPAYGWDGIFRGKPMNPAVFVWYAAVEFIDGRVELFKGDVTLMR